MPLLQLFALLVASSPPPTSSLLPRPAALPTLTSPSKTRIQGDQDKNGLRPIITFEEYIEMAEYQEIQTSMLGQTHFEILPPHSL